MRKYRALLSCSLISLISLISAGCGDDVVEVLPSCDEIDWPLGIETDIAPPAPEFAVECADGWGNRVATRPALDTFAVPGATWFSRPDPTGGWVHVILPEHLPGWTPWLDARGVEPASLSYAPVLRVEVDGSLDWVRPELGIWMFDFVGDELWALGEDADEVRSLLVLDPASGEVLDSRPWDFAGRYEVIEAARDPAGGAWITAFEEREADDLVDQHLYRALTVDTVELVATRTTEAPKQVPWGGLHALHDGAVAWWTTQGFEVIEPDGTVRWSHADGYSTASDADSMLILSLSPTGFGNGHTLRLENVALADGATQWTREHRRYTLAEPEHCGPDDCTLFDFAYPVARPDGGYLLLGRHAYPSSTCAWQPWIMAVSAAGDAEWAHRVETCGWIHRVAFRADSKIEILGVAGLTSGLEPSSAWTRWLEL